MHAIINTSCRAQHLNVFKRHTCKRKFFLLTQWVKPHFFFLNQKSTKNTSLRFILFINGERIFLNVNEFEKNK